MGAANRQEPVFLPVFLRLGHRLLQRIHRDVPVGIVPDGLTILHQHGLGAGMLGTHPVGKGQRNRPFFNDSDKGQPNLCRLGCLQKIRPRTVGLGADRSGGRMLEYQHRFGCRGGQHPIQISHRQKLLDFTHLRNLLVPSSVIIISDEKMRASGTTVMFGPSSSYIYSGHTSLPWRRSRRRQERGRIR